MLIFKGSYGNFDCLAGNNDECQGCGLEAGITFQPEPKTTYLVLVFGLNDFTNGDFVVQARTAFDTPLNDECDSVMPLVAGEMIIRRSTNATMNSVPICGDTKPIVLPGVWYFYQSDAVGSKVRISTCIDFADPVDFKFNNQMLIFTGTCENLECITFNDNEETQEPCGNKADITF